MAYLAIDPRNFLGAVCNVEHYESAHESYRAFYFSFVKRVTAGKCGTNKLRTLCPTCHALRACHRHQGMIAKSLSIGVIPVNWRDLVWEDDKETIERALK
ncbi:hypothetical protein ACWE42_20605 [Sutcliffiella cohnii]